MQQQNNPALLQTNYFHGLILSVRMPKPGSMSFFKQSTSSHVFFKQLLELDNVTTVPLLSASYSLHGTYALLDQNQNICLNSVYK